MEYEKIIKAIQQKAKEACIQLLKNNPSGSFIDLFDKRGEDYDFPEIVDGNENNVTVTSVGLDADGNIVYRGDDGYGEEMNKGNWGRFDMWSNPYGLVYNFILEYADKATPTTDIPFRQYGKSELEWMD